MATLKAMAGIIFLLMSLLFAFMAYVLMEMAKSGFFASETSNAVVNFFACIYFLIAAFCSYRLLLSAQCGKPKSLAQRIIVLGAALIVLYNLYLTDEDSAYMVIWMIAVMLYIACAITLALPHKGRV